MKAGTVAMAAAAAGAWFLIRQVGRSRVRPSAAGGKAAEPRNRWRAVTVNRPLNEVSAAGALPALDDLGEVVEIRISKSADAKGTEIAARLREPEPSGPVSAIGRLTGDDRRQAVREALRQSKQLLETGEVLRVDPRSAGDRTSTPGGWLVDVAARRAGAEGVL